MNVQPGTGALGARIRQLLSDRGMTAAEAQRRAKLSPTFLRDIFSGRSASPKFDNLVKLADVLGVSVAEMAGNAEPAGLFEIPGLAENQLDPWVPDTSAPPPPPGARSMMVDLAPHARHPTGLKLRESIVGFGLLCGDVVVIDMNARAEPGNLVVVNAIDHSTGNGVTLIRRYHPPYLISGDPLDSGALLADGAHYAIMGPVVASFRDHSMRKS